MSTLTITTTYDTAAVLTEAQLDAIKTPIETLFNTTQIEGSNIQANILDAATYLDDDSITTVKIPDNAVTATKFVDSTPSTDTGITSAKISTDAITTAKLADLNVTVAKIAALAVTTGKLASASIPKTIMLALPTASSNMSDTTVSKVAALSSVSGTETLVGSISTTGLTSGKPLIIALQSTSTTTGYGGVNQTHVGGVAGSPVLYTQRVETALILKRDGATVCEQRYALGDIPSTTIYSRFPLSTFVYIDTNPSTSHTYSLYIRYIGVASTYLDGTAPVYPQEVISGSSSIDSAKLVSIQII